MSIKKQKKATAIEVARSMLSRTNFFIVVGYNKLAFDKIEKLRKQLNESKSKMIFLKNTVAKIAFGELLKSKDILNSNFFVFGNDVVAMSFYIKKFLTNTDCSIKICFYDYNEIPSNSVAILSELPNINVARAQLYSTLSGVAGGMHQSMSMINYRFANYLDQVVDNKS